MNTNLITYDMENFLEKYTRFMTKDIYIDYVLYNNFLNQYNYLYDELEKNAILFRENIKYKKIINIKKNKINLLKLHNQKYLKKALVKYQSFFEDLGYDKLLDTNKKGVILSDEEKILFINNKNNKELIVGKVKYLVDYFKIPENKILVLTDDEEKISKELKDKDIEKVTCHKVDYYKNIILEGKKIVSKKEKYDILFSYLTGELFLDKKKFDKLYLAFSNNIYLNKDYKDFDTFRDYHNYFYKKVYLTSNLSLKKYTENEIEKRKTYLRTLDNKRMNKKEEVDVANFLLLNGIDYFYSDGVFKVQNNDKVSYISFVKKDDGNDNVFLEKKDLFGNNYVEKLVYELIKRRYPFNLLSDNEIYDKLRDTTIHNYFNEFIYKILIPAIDYYDEFGTFSNTRYNDEQIEVLKSIYNYYKNYLNDNELMTENDLKVNLEKRLEVYKYLIIDGDIDINPKVKMLKIINDYNEDLNLLESVKLLYDYKNYLIDNSSLPIKYAYRDNLELKELTDKFKQNYLEEIKTSEDFLQKKINIYIYDDDKRLLVNKNISKLVFKILKDNNIKNGRKKTKDILIGVENSKEIDNLVLRNCFSKYDKSSIVDTLGNIITYLKVDEIKMGYKKIILPFLIKDAYHENLLLNDSKNEFEIIISIVLNKCNDELIVLCPSSKKNELKKNFKNIHNIKILDS